MAGEFKPFPVPTLPTDLPLVTHAGEAYRCSGCGDRVPDGAWITEEVRDGMVVGILVRRGKDGPVDHGCGTKAEVT